MKLWLQIAWVLFFASASSLAEGPSVTTLANGTEAFQVPLASGKVTIDGKVNEPAWDAALKVELGYEVRPGENIAPPVRTEVFLIYTDHSVLVAAKCYDPHPDRIRARFRDRDDAWSDDWIGVMFDTFNDSRRGYEFIVNPLGVQIDAINDEVNGNYDTNWNAIWYSNGRITDQGWEIEMEIPFNQLRFQSGEEAQVWGFDSFRSYPRNDRHHIGFFPRDRSNSSYLVQSKKLVGFSGADPGKNLEIVPTVTGVQTDARANAGDPLQEVESDQELGVTMRWGITPNMRLNATANPDFSQVEADAVQLDINETFALFYSETRPFFQEGADLFRSRLGLLHTRTIADPNGALKLTGKKGHHTYGIFSAQDEITNLIIPGSQGSSGGSFDFQTTDSVARYRYDFGRNSTAGLMVTDREGSGYYNRVFAADTRYRLTENDQFNLNAAYAMTQYNQSIDEQLGTGLDEIKDYALSFGYLHSERNWEASLAYNDLGEDFRADLGFEPQVNYRKLVAGGSYLWHGSDNTFYNRILIGGDWDQSEEQDGELLERELESWLNYQGPLESNVWISGGHRTRVFNGVSFDQDYQSVEFSINPTADLFTFLSWNYGDWIDFTHTRPAKREVINPRINYHLGRHLFTQAGYRHQVLEVDGERLFKAQILEARVIYHVNNRLLFRAIIQNTEIKRNVAMYSDPVAPKDRDLFTQLLVSYKLNPSTKAFLGYTDSQYESEEVDLTTMSRTFFVKFGYAWVP